MDSDAQETRLYGILISMLSRAKVDDGITPDEVLGDSIALCGHHELHFCPRFSSREEVIAAARSTHRLWYSERGLIHIDEREDARGMFREFATANEHKEHFNFVHDTCLTLVSEFHEKGYNPPLIVPTNSFNAERLYPLKGKKSLEPDIMVITRDKTSHAEFGYCTTVAVEAQRGSFKRLYEKLEKYRELILGGERLFLLIVITEGLREHVEAFRKRAGMMGFVETVNYQLVIIRGKTEASTTSKFQRIASSVK